MSNIFIFSDNLRNLGKILKFQFKKTCKWFYILFSRNRKLEQVSFNYFKNWHFENAYLVVDLEYNKAIWYRIGNFKSIFSNKPLVINLSNIKSSSFNIEVHGFFQKKIISVDLKKKEKIYPGSFQTMFLNLREVQIDSNKISLQILNPEILISTPQFQLNNLVINTQEIEINHNQFKIQDYI